MPVVVRMEGTNVEEGRRILAESGLALITAAEPGRCGRQDCRYRQLREPGMSIFIDHKTSVLVQGITGREGSSTTRQCLEYGTAWWPG